MENDQQKIERHLEEFWNPRTQVHLSVDQGPVVNSIPSFSVIRFSPTEEKPYWIFCTLGCFKVDSGHQRHEFFLLSPTESSQHVLTLSMLANFHADSRYRLGPGNVVEIGDPWLPGSSCDHLL